MYVYIYTIDIELIYNIVLISAAQQSDSVIHVYIPIQVALPGCTGGKELPC